LRNFNAAPCAGLEISGLALSDGHISPLRAFDFLRVFFYFARLSAFQNDELVLAPIVNVQHLPALTQHVLKSDENSTGSVCGAKGGGTAAEEAEQHFNDVLAGVEVLLQVLKSVVAAFKRYVWLRRIMMMLMIIVAGKQRSAVVVRLEQVDEVDS
jgi:hypothetical protein